jgi:hypothetical protein
MLFNDRIRARRESCHRRMIDLFIAKKTLVVPNQARNFASTNALGPPSAVANGCSWLH